MTQHDPQTGPRVAIHARVLPHGITGPADDEAGDRVAKATLLLSPGRVLDVGDEDGIPLARWPIAVRNLLMQGTARFRVSPVAQDASSMTLQPGAVQDIAFDIPKVDDLTDAEMDQILQMWVHSLWPDQASDDHQWQSLADRLAASVAGTDVTTGDVCNVGTPDDPSKTAPDVALYGADGQLAPNTPLKRAPSQLKVTTALTIGHANLAIALECQRAQALAVSLNRACGLDVSLPIAPLKLPVSQDAKGYAGANASSEDSTLVQELVRAIADLPPRGSDALEVYAAKLTAVLDTATIPPAETNPVALVLDLLVTNANVVAELRRKRKIAERQALFAHLEVERKQTADLYANAQIDLANPGKCGRPTPSWIDRAVTPGLCASTTPDFATLTKSAQYANWPQYRTSKDTPNRTSEDVPERPDSGQHLINQLDEMQTEALEQASRAFFTLQSTPSLARAFFLAIEVDITTDLDRLLTAVPRFGHISVALDNTAVASDQPPPWTLFRSRSVLGASNEGAFWPATRAEADCPDLRHHTRHYGGLLVMGFGASLNPNAHVPRFDITSLDIRTALELEVQRRAILQADLDAEAEASASEAAATARDAAARQIASNSADENVQSPNDRIAEGAALDRTNRRLRPGMTTNLNETGAVNHNDSDEGDRQDVGLTLLDRGLIDDSVYKMAVKAAKCDPTDRTSTQGIVIDAEDLIIGYRLFVGKPSTAEATGNRSDWRPLMDRTIEFGTTGPYPALNTTIEIVLRKLIGPNGGDERRALEAAMMNAPGRMLPKTQHVNDAPQDVEAVFEEAISVWDGGPMGVDCAEVPGQEHTTGDALIFGRELSLNKDGDDRPHRLRHGQPYRFALAAVYSNGRSVPPTAFPEITQQTSQSPAIDVFYPSDAMASAGQNCAPDGAEVRPYVRALRQAKIAAPQVVMPEGHGQRTNGPMGPDHTGLMVIRNLVNTSNQTETSDRKITERGRPSIAQRIVMVPSIPQARAVAHTSLATNEGVFDHISDTHAGPPLGTFRSVKQHRGTANLPSLRNAFLTGLNGRQHFDHRAIIEDDVQTPLKEGDVQGGAVFASRSRGSTSYYPDPAADHLAVRLKIWGRRTPITMTGLSDLVPLYAGNTYPDLIPVVLSLRAHDTTTDPRTTWADFVTFNENIKFNPENTDDIVGAGRSFSGAELDLRLAPHEWADIEMWFVPTAKRLARDFSVLQSLAIDLSQKGNGSLICCAQGVLDGAAGTLPEALLDDLKHAITEGGGRRAYFGPGGLVSPPMGVLLALAEQVCETMVSCPVPEIAATATLSAVSAANQPNEAPVINPAMTEHFARPAETEPLLNGGLRAWRPSRDVTETPMIQPHPCLCEENLVELDVAAAGSTQLVMTGNVDLNLNEIDTIEVRAVVTMPGTDVFDDKLRGRSLSHRKANWWPLVGDPSGAPAIKHLGVTDAEEVAFLPSRDLFGFTVRQDGKVQLDRAEVTLLRAERLPRRDDGTCMGTVSLRSLFEECDPNVAITQRHLFPDGKARRMQVYVNGLSRTAEFMRTIDRRARAGDPWISTDGHRYSEGDLIPGEALPATWQSKRSEDVEVILPATIRPAKADARPPEPAFRWEPPLHEPARLRNGRLERRRASVIRIPLGREWYSSGEDEKLGIVLWPPNLQSDDTFLAKNTAQLTLIDDDGGNRVVDLNGTISDRPHNPSGHLGTLSQPDIPPFEDSHLGPGGRFVSRRGADPVREGLPHKQIFFSPVDFPDLGLEDTDIRKAQLVTNVSMPLSSDPSEGSPDTDNTEPPTPPMMVSLLLYTPRFDTENEEWYVDVELADSPAAETFVRFGLVRYQPHSRPDLRCSRPVEQWVQPLPCRNLEVWRRSADDGWRIRMCGPTFNRRRVSDLVTSDLASPEIAPSTGPILSEPTPAESHCTTDPDGVQTGPEAAPRMAISIRRGGHDATGRPFQEVIPLPVPTMGRDSLLLRPFDHDTGVVPFDHVLKETPGSGLAARVLFKAGFADHGQGVWVANILDSALHAYDGPIPIEELHILIEETEMFEPDVSVTVEESLAAPTLSVPRIPGAAIEPAENPEEQPDPKSLAPSFDLSGPRFMIDFSLTTLAQEQT